MVKITVSTVYVFRNAQMSPQFPCSTTFTALQYKALYCHLSEHFHPQKLENIGQLSQLSHDRKCVLAFSLAGIFLPLSLKNFYNHRENTTNARNTAKYKLHFLVFTCVPHKHLQQSSLWNIPIAQPGKILVSVCTAELNFTVFPFLRFHHVQILISPVSESFCSVFLYPFLKVIDQCKVPIDITLFIVPIASSLQR